MQKMEIIFVYLSNTSNFMHFQSVRQKKGNIHNKTNKYRWHFRSKPHQTTSLMSQICMIFILLGNKRRVLNFLNILNEKQIKEQVTIGLVINIVYYALNPGVGNIYYAHQSQVDRVA